MMRVLLVDDHEVYRSSVRALLEGAGIEVSGEAGDGATAVALAHPGSADVIAIDLHLPVLSGVDAVERIAAVPGTPLVVAMSMDDDPALIDAALRAGARRFVPKGADPTVLIDAIVDTVRMHDDEPRPGH